MWKLDVSVYTCHIIQCLFPLLLWHRLLLSVPKGASMCHSHNVCIPWWILICRLFRCVRKASPWPPCLSGLNCLITVIIWTGSEITWHPDTMLALLKEKKKKKLWKLSWCCGVSKGWMKTPGVWSTDLWDVLTYIQQTARMHIQYIHLHVSEFPTSPGHFGAIRCQSLGTFRGRSTSCVTYSWLS